MISDACKELWSKVSENVLSLKGQSVVWKSGNDQMTTIQDRDKGMVYESRKGGSDLDSLAVATFFGDRSLYVEMNSNCYVQLFDDFLLRKTTPIPGTNIDSSFFYNGISGLGVLKGYSGNLEDIQALRMLKRGLLRLLPDSMTTREKRSLIHIDVPTCKILGADSCYTEIDELLHYNGQMPSLPAPMNLKCEAVDRPHGLSIEVKEKEASVTITGSDGSWYDWSLNIFAADPSNWKLTSSTNHAGVSAGYGEGDLCTGTLQQKLLHNRYVCNLDGQPKIDDFYRFIESARAAYCN